MSQERMPAGRAVPAVPTHTAGDGAPLSPLLTPPTPHHQLPRCGDGWGQRGDLGVRVAPPAGSLRAATVP